MGSARLPRYSVDRTALDWIWSQGRRQRIAYNLICFGFVHAALFSGSAVSRPAHAETADIGRLQHAVTGSIGVSPLYIQQPSRSEQSTSYAEFAAQYTYRLRYVAFGAALSFQNASVAAYPLAELLLPISRVELAATLGYGAAYAWRREYITGVGRHVSASLRVLIHVEANFDLGVAAAVAGETHSGAGDYVDFSWAGAPIRVVGRYRF